MGKQKTPKRKARTSWFSTLSAARPSSARGLIFCHKIQWFWVLTTILSPFETGRVCFANSLGGGRGLGGLGVGDTAAAATCWPWRESAPTRRRMREGLAGRVEEAVLSGCVWGVKIMLRVFGCSELGWAKNPRSPPEPWTEEWGWGQPSLLLLFIYEALDTPAPAACEVYVIITLVLFIF